MKRKIPVSNNKAIELPSDYVEYKKIGFIMKDGVVKINYNPDLKKDSVWNLAVRGIKEIKNDADCR